MPTTNRPFFANFFAAFRAQSSYSKATSTSPTSVGSTTPTSALASHPRSIATKGAHSSSGAAAAAAAMQAAAHFQAARTHSTSPMAAPTNFQRSRTPSRQRRGSDSSSEGFKDARGADKWYIGGRTATGEVTFYKLGMVKRYHSNDELSLDRLSLESR